MSRIKEILNYKLSFSDDISISVKGLLFVILVIILTWIVLKIIKRILTRNLPKEDKAKFNTVFSNLFIPTLSKIY